MEISLSHINELTITVIGESSSYPRKNDCHKVTITKDDQSYESDYFPKTKLTLIRKLQSIAGNVSEDELKELVVAINEHVEYEVNVAEGDIYMSQSEDI